MNQARVELPQVLSIGRQKENTTRVNNVTLSQFRADLVGLVLVRPHMA